MAIVHPFIYFVPAIAGAFVLHKFILYLLDAD